MERGGQGAGQVAAPVTQDELTQMARTPQAKKDAEQVAPDAMAEINAMIGLDPVKDELKSMIALAKYRQAMKEQGFDVKSTSLNQVFEGRPGTGKSRVARMYADALVEGGMMPGTQGGAGPAVVEHSPQTLKGEYEGQTAPKMQQAFDEARGGVLFIDEANAWANPNDSYGVEAMSALMKLTEDNREDVAVVLGGYPGLRNALQRVDPGLPRRFPSNVVFPRYSPQEKVKIGRKMAADNNLKLPRGAAKKYAEVIQRLPGEAGDVENFNGFMVRSIALRRERAKDKTAFDAKKLRSITPADIDYAIARYRDNKGRTIEEAWNQDHPEEAANAVEPKVVGRRKRPAPPHPADQEGR